MGHGSSLSSVDLLLVSHAMSLVSIELAKPAKVLDADHRLRAAVTEGLLGQPPVD
jgi:PucR family transcriptional regulator, purine catabolism regulatory protein